MGRNRVIILAAAVLGLVGGSASAQTRAFNLTGFDRVSASAGVTVILAQGPFSVKAEEAGGNFDRLKLEVDGSTLVVSRTTDFGWLWLAPNRHYTVTVTAPAFTRVSASSGSDVSGKISPQNLDLSVSSGADLRLSGACAALTAEVSSGGNLDGAALRCHTANLRASSGGDLRAWVESSVRGDASSGGSIVIQGQPPMVEKRQSSGGSVRLSPA